MITFYKANMASLVASVSDFFITVIVFQFFHTSALTAGVTGTAGGGIINFLMGRHWVFNAGKVKAHRQAGRYMLVWSGNLLLNGAGMYILAQKAGWYYLLAKVITSVLVAVGYNYPLQKKFVFRIN